jgi:L-threonine-O-3-phosphate decarboxylase
MSTGDSEESGIVPAPRPELLHASEAVHGALDFAELERFHWAPEDILDFSVNGNPYGPSPHVREAMARVAIERYPDREVLVLRRALAQHWEVPAEHIIVGNGSAELLWLLALAFLRRGDAVLVVEPTFGEYARVAALMGAQLHFWTAPPAQGFNVDLQGVRHALQRLRPRLAFVCNPNNPTGTCLESEAIVAWARLLPQTLFVVDEAYLPFASGAPSVLRSAVANLLVLQSMTKAYALAGLRLGYAIGHPTVIRALALARPPWNVNALAQAAGLAALADQAHLTRSLAQLTAARSALIQGLQAMNVALLPSTTHFFLLQVQDATALRRALLQHGILVRDCTSFGLPGYIRIATRLPAENDRLLSALARVPLSTTSHLTESDHGS